MGWSLGCSPVARSAGYGLAKSDAGRLRLPSPEFHSCGRLKSVVEPVCESCLGQALGGNVASPECHFVPQSGSRPRASEEPEQERIAARAGTAMTQDEKTPTGPPGERGSEREKGASFDRRSGSPGDEELTRRLKQELAPELELLRQLGRGSMATVYLAREQELKRLVAIKVLSPKLSVDDRARRRFEREAQAAAALSHPNIVAVHRVGRLSNGIPYIVMQYVKGRTLADRLVAEGRLPPDRARSLMAEVALALAAAHQRGIVHRDVRPANILYDEESGQCLLADFGIAAILPSGEAPGSTRLTRTGELVGDPAYMSPEQLKGNEITERSDVYALGLVGYELLTGRGPYEATSRREKLTAHMQQEPRKLSELLADADKELEELLLRCLAKDPQHRPNAADLAQRLQAAPSGVTPAPPVPGPPQPGLLSRLMERRLPQITGAWFHGKRGRQKIEPLEYWVFGGLALIWLAVSAFILIQWRNG